MCVCVCVRTNFQWTLLGCKSSNRQKLSSKNVSVKNFDRKVSLEKGMYKGQENADQLNKNPKQSRAPEGLAKVCVCPKYDLQTAKVSTVVKQWHSMTVGRIENLNKMSRLRNKKANSNATQEREGHY